MFAILVIMQVDHETDFLLALLFLNAENWIVILHITFTIIEIM